MVNTILAILIGIGILVALIAFGFLVNFLAYGIIVLKNYFIRDLSYTTVEILGTVWWLSVGVFLILVSILACWSVGIAVLHSFFGITF